MKGYDTRIVTSLNGSQKQVGISILIAVACKKRKFGRAGSQNNESLSRNRI